MAATERFIPYRKNDIKQRCKAALAVELQPGFKRCAALIDALYHATFHHELEHLKDLYSCHNPDRDTVTLPGSLEAEAGAFGKAFSSLLEKANYERIADSEVQAALAEESLFNIRLEVDFDEFDDCLIYYRNAEDRQETLSRWFGLRKQQLNFTNYSRVVLFLRFKSAEWFERNKRPTDRAVPGGTLLKLFKDVPKADMEMLFPNTRVGMKTLDKLMIGVPALASGAVVVFTKLGPTLLLVGSVISFWLGFSGDAVTIDQAALITLGVGLASLGAVLWREFNKFKNRKIQFMQTLSENLYFRNLDNNQGVIHRILDSAEEEECKEAILGYFMMLNLGVPTCASDLDKAIEQWLEEELGARLDFEIGDSLRKLQSLAIVSESEGLWSAKDPQTAISQLQALWQKAVDGDPTALTGL